MIKLRKRTSLVDPEAKAEQKLKKLKIKLEDVE